MSLLAPIGLPAACSGDMYAIVPSTTPALVGSAPTVRVASADGMGCSCNFAMPKSASFA
jgi:hypothetical protein